VRFVNDITQKLVMAIILLLGMLIKKNILFLTLTRTGFGLEKIRR